MSARAKRGSGKPTAERARGLPSYPLWDSQHDEEPAWSALARTVERNMPGTAAARFHDLGAYGGHGVAKASVREIARICELDPDVLERASARVGPRYATLLGHRLRRDDFSVARRRWCPACLADHGRHLAWWDVTVISSCPRHRLELVDRCPCGETIRWKGQAAFSRCNCGVELAEVAARPLGEAEGRADGYVVGRLTARDDAVRLPVLDRLTVHDALEVLRNVGHLALAPTSGRRPAERKAGFLRLLDAGYAGMESFPGSFRSLLDGVLERADVPALKFGTHRIYGQPFMWWLLHEAPGRLGSRLADEVREHAAANLTLNKRSLLGTAIVRKRVGLISAAEICGVNFGRMRRILIATGMLPRTGGRIYASFDRREIQGLAESMRGGVTMKQVAAELDVNVGFVGAFVEVGLLAPVFPRDTAAAWLFPPRAAKQLMGALSRRVSPAEGATGLPIPLAAKSLGIEMAAIVREVLDGSLRAVGHDPAATGLGSILVDVAGLRRERRLAASDTLAARDVARLFDVKEEDAIALLKVGAISSERDGHMWRADRGSAEAFFREHALLSPYADRLGTSRKYLALSLERAGIRPAFAPPVVRRKLFLRADVDGYLATHGWPPAGWRARHPLPRHGG